MKRFRSEIWKNDASANFDFSHGLTNHVAMSKSTGNLSLTGSTHNTETMVANSGDQLTQCPTEHKSDPVQYLSLSPIRNKETNLEFGVSEATISHDARTIQPSHHDNSIDSSTLSKPPQHTYTITEIPVPNLAIPLIPITSREPFSTSSMGNPGSSSDFPIPVPTSLNVKQEFESESKKTKDKTTENGGVEEISLPFFVEDDDTCPVCSDKVSGYHYGLQTCESCKGFFKRTVQNKKTYNCVENKNCKIDKAHRKRCPFCRFQKCMSVGMRIEAVRENKMRGGRNKFGPMYKRDRARKQQLKALNRASGFLAKLDSASFQTALKAGVFCSVEDPSGSLQDSMLECGANPGIPTNDNADGAPCDSSGKMKTKNTKISERRLLFETDPHSKSNSSPIQSLTSKVTPDNKLKYLDIDRGSSEKSCTKPFSYQPHSIEIVPAPLNTSNILKDSQTSRFLPPPLPSYSYNSQTSQLLNPWPKYNHHAYVDGLTSNSATIPYSKSYHSPPYMHGFSNNYNLPIPQPAFKNCGNLYGGEVVPDVFNPYCHYQNYHWSPRQHHMPSWTDTISSKNVYPPGPFARSTETGGPPSCVPGHRYIDNSGLFTCFEGEDKSAPDFLNTLLQAEFTEEQIQDSVLMRLNSCPPTIDKFETLCQIADQTLFIIVEWAQASPFFQQLDTQEKMTLLHNSWLELLILDHVKRQINHSEENLVLVTGDIYPIDSICHDSDDPLSLYGSSSPYQIIQRSVELVNKMRNLHVDQVEMVCLKFLILFNTDVSDAGSGQTESVKERVNEALCQYSSKRYGDQLDRVNQLLMRLSEIRSLSLNCEEYLMRRHSIDKLPRNNLLMEMLFAKRHMPFHVPDNL